MRSMRSGPVVTFILLLLAIPIQAQQSVATAPAPRDPQSLTLLQRSLAAIVGANTLKDVTLSASVRRLAGSDDETGTAILKATYAGQARIDLNFPSGQSSEVADSSNGAPKGSWCGPDGTWHPTAGQNLLTEPAWFFPTFLLSRVLSAPNFAVTPADVETKDGISVEHFAVYRQTAHGKLIASLSRADVYLDASTLLPVAIAFNIHPDNDALTDIPIEVRFSNYQNSQGILVPYHIQKYMQNGLALDVTVTSVQANSGIAATEFQAQ